MRQRLFWEPKALLRWIRGRQAESDDHHFSIWSLPTSSQVSDQMIDQPLAVLKGHKGPVYSVCFNHRTETLASAGDDGIIKLWTPIPSQ